MEESPMKTHRGSSPLRTLRFALLFALVGAAPLAAQDADWQTIEFETTEVTDPDLTVSPDGETLVFTMLGHLFRVSVDGGEAEQLTFGPYWDSEPAFSPDGRGLAFVSDRDGGEGSVFVLDLGTGEMTQITREQWVSRPTWSPDGSALAYLSLSGVREGCPDDSAIVRRVALGGGQPQTLSASPGLINSLFNLPDGRLAWTVLETGRYAGAEPRTRIDAMNDEGSVVSMDTLPGLWTPVVPDSRGQGFYGLRRIHVRDVGFRPREDVVLHHVSESGVDHPIISLPSTGCLLVAPRFAVAPDGEALYLGDAGHLIRLSLSSGAAEQVAFRSRVSMEVIRPVEPPRLSPAGAGGVEQPRSLTDLRLAPDGRSLVFGALGWLWEQPLDSRPARRLFEGSGFERQPAFSPDGSRIAFVHSEDGVQELRVVDLATREIRTLESGAYFGRPGWSPDGVRLVAAKREEGRFRILAFGPEEGSRRVLAGALLEGWLPRPQISADGRFLYYTAGNEGTAALFRLPLDDTSIPEPVTQPPRHVQEALVCPDERCVVYRRNEEIWFAPLAEEQGVAGEPRRLSMEGGETFALVPDGSAVIYAAGDRVWRQALDGGERKEIPIRLELEHQEPAPLLLRNLRLLDFDSLGFGPATSVLIEDGRIVRTGREAEQPLPDGTRVMDAGGRFAIPGLFDMHVHVEAVGGSFDTNQEAFLAWGVTSVRDMGERLSWVQALADRSTSTADAVPRYFYPGEVFEPARPGHVGWGLLLDDAADAKVYLQRWKERGVHFVKTHHPPGSWLLDRTVAEESRRLGLQLAGDPGPGTRIGEIARYVAWGYASIEHTGQVPIRMHDDVLQLLAAAGTRWVPTVGLLGLQAALVREDPESLQDPKLRAFLPEDATRAALISALHWPSQLNRLIWHEALANIREAHLRGVRLLLGSDTYGNGGAGSSLALEMELFARAGLEPVEVIRLATLEAAEALGVDHELGSLEPGKLADILLLDADPLEDIRNSQAIWRVIKGGWVFDPEELKPGRTDLATTGKREPPTP
jgi:Tol biopolymer transport system component